MALTGFFLCLFLVIHLFGNLQLLLPAEAARWQFNFYSKLLSGNILIELISYILFASILAHAIYALLITIHNRRSNGKRYEYDRRSVSSNWIDAGYGVGPLKNAVYLDFSRAINEQGREKIEEKYGNLFRMYQKITGINGYAEPMRISPAAHFSMGGL
jgi:hypothetical protein